MRLPSTQALRGLEAFTRHGSVWRAAVEEALMLWQWAQEDWAAAGASRTSHDQARLEEA